MVFGFYDNLTSRQQSIYRQSDEIKYLRLAETSHLTALANQLVEALPTENKKAVEKICQTIVDTINKQFNAPPLKLQVLAVRPSADWGELHGLYLPEDNGELAKIQVWMRTAKNKKIVAFKSFLRTVLHELCHHLDYEHFGFPETFHTEGFYSRESSLFKQIYIPKENAGN